MLMEHSGAQFIFQASRQFARFSFRGSDDSHERDGGHVEVHVRGESHSRPQIESDGAQDDVKMVRDEEGGHGLQRLAEPNRCGVRGVAPLLRGDERVLHDKPKKYRERMPIWHTIHDERTYHKVWIRLGRRIYISG